MEVGGALSQGYRLQKISEQDTESAEVSETKCAGYGDSKSRKT